jgi:uncharacterized protein (TIGR00251 family)
VTFVVHVSPRAKREAVGSLYGDALRVAVREAPSKGDANRACLRLLGKVLAIPARDLTLCGGERNRRKRIRATGDPERLEEVLRALARLS